MEDDKKGECPICFEKLNSLKFLDCGHTFCAKCIKTQTLFFAVERGDQKKCPIDQKFTVLPDGCVGALKTKLFVDLPCGNCYENKSINDCWWCEICQLTICSRCAMKKHKDHVCHEWQDFDVVKECYALYKSNICDTQDVRKWQNSVHELCVRLEEKLIKLVDGDDCLKNVLVSLESTFGRIEEISLTDSHTVDKLEQKLSTISNIMQKVSGYSTLPQISNVVKTKQCPTLPSAEEVFEFCSKLKKSGDSSAEATPLSESSETG